MRGGRGNFCKIVARQTGRRQSRSSSRIKKESTATAQISSWVRTPGPRSRWSIFRFQVSGFATVTVLNWKLQAWVLGFRTSGTDGFPDVAVRLCDGWWLRRGTGQSRKARWRRKHGNAGGARNNTNRRAELQRTLGVHVCNLLVVVVANTAASAVHRMHDRHVQLAI